MTDEPFYLERIPQSVYRKATNAKSENQKINLSLPDLSQIDPKIKEEIRKKIKEQADKIVKAILPEDKLTEAFSSEKMLDSIYLGLGIK